MDQSTNCKAPSPLRTAQPELCQGSTCSHWYCWPKPVVTQLLPVLNSSDQIKPPPSQGRRGRITVAGEPRPFNPQLDLLKEGDSANSTFLQISNMFTQIQVNRATTQNKHRCMCICVCIYIYIYIYIYMAMGQKPVPPSEHPNPH